MTQNNNSKPNPKTKMKQMRKNKYEKRFKSMQAGGSGNQQGNGNSTPSKKEKTDDEQGIFSTIWGYILKIINFIVDKFNEITRTPELIKYISNVVNKFFSEYGGYAAIIVYFVLVFMVFLANPFDVTNKYKASTIATVLIGGFLIMMISNFTYARRKLEYTDKDREESEEGNNYDDAGNETIYPTLKRWLMKTMGALSLIGVVCAVIYGILLLSTNFNSFITYFSDISFYLAFFVGAAIAIKLLTPKLEEYKIKDKIGEFADLLRAFIVYIPCLIIDITENIVGTKKSIWVLLAIEFFILLAYFGIPFLLKSNMFKFGIVLSSEPQYLNKPVMFDNDKLTKIMDNSVKKMQYAIAADIWINPQPTSTSLAYNQDTNILSFGDRIKIQYNGQTPDVLVVKALEGKEIVEVARPKIYLQRWNKIVVNYDHGVVDLFVNGELVRSQQNVPYMMAAGLSAGSANGIYGGIKDVRMFDVPLSKNMIDYM